MAEHKGWTIQAVSEDGAPLAFHRHGAVLSVGGAQAVEISPVEYLLIAAAGCLALSCRTVLKGDRGPGSRVEVTAIGSKAAEPPSRLARITLAVRFAAPYSAAEASAIIEKAEKLCTVTNTLRGEIAIEIA